MATHFAVDLHCVYMCIPTNKGRTTDGSLSLIQIQFVLRCSLHDFFNGFIYTLHLVMVS